MFFLRLFFLKDIISCYIYMCSVLRCILIIYWYFSTLLRKFLLLLLILFLSFWWVSNIHRNIFLIHIECNKKCFIIMLGIYFVFRSQQWRKKLDVWKFEVNIIWISRNRFDIIYCSLTSNLSNHLDIRKWGIVICNFFQHAGIITKMKLLRY